MPSHTAEVFRQALLSVADADWSQVSDRELLRRFARHNDQAAFAAVVSRHAGMVFGVCRRLLSHWQDAEDACQATFLVLARNARSVRWQASVANYLFTAARKVARNAQVAAQRRARRERQAAVPESVQPADEMTARELLASLDRELERLPPLYREPLVLCYLEGLTRDEAAGRLGVPAGTLKIRLERGRKRLGDALKASGCTLGVGLLALAATSSAEASPPRLLEAILATASGSVPPTVATLTEGVAVNGIGKKLVLAVLVITALAALGLGLGSLALNAADRPEPDKEKPQAENSKPADGSQAFTYSGKVLSPDGKPVAGARMFVSGLKPGVIEFVPRTKTADDGTFQFTIRRDEFGDKGYVPPSRSPPEKFVFVGVMADGYGSTAEFVGQPSDRENLTYWLPVEEIIKGRVVDLEGKPVAGVRVNANLRGGHKDKDRKPLPYDTKAPARTLDAMPYDPEQMLATTDKDGRVVLRGLGKDWLYDVSISGPTIVSTKAWVAGRPVKPTTVPGGGEYLPDKGMPKILLYGSEFTHVAAPCKPILGTVREKGTGKPIAGANVMRVWHGDDEPSVSAETDKDGKFTLTGLPRGLHTLTFRRPPNSPYLDAEVKVEALQPGTESVTKDIEIDRQPAATGRVTDQATGKPVRGWVEYRPLASNSNLKGKPLLAEPRESHWPPTSTLDGDGRFLLPVLPGPGVLLVRADGDYLPSHLAREHRADGIVVNDDTDLIDSRPLPAWPAQFHAYKIIDVKEGNDAEAALTVTAGRKRTLTLEFPDGKPRTVTVLGARPRPGEPGDVFFAGDEAVVQGLSDGEVRRLFVTSHDHQFAATASVDGSESGPVAIKLQPTATLTGRLLDKDGKPLKGQGFQLLYDEGEARGRLYLSQLSLRISTPDEQKREERTGAGGWGERSMYFYGPELSDDQGRFRLPGVMPSLGFHLHVILISEPDAKGQKLIKGKVKLARGTAKPSETLDLGDLNVSEPLKD